jgi:hypothetical protein
MSIPSSFTTPRNITISMSPPPPPPPQTEPILPSRATLRPEEPFQLSSLEKIHSYSNNHFMYKIKIKDLLSMQIKNWEMNRPADIDRFREIIKYLASHKGATDWMFYMIYENNTYKIIDGLHRFTAIQLMCLSEEYTQQYDLVDLYLIKEKSVFVSILISPSIGETIDKFQTLNKSIPISELYISPVENVDKRKIIEELSRVWMSLYKPHFVHSPNPQIPNTNRDRFIDILDILYEKNFIHNSTKHILENKLNDLNKFIKENIPTRVSPKALQKCGETGCYLFLVKKDVLEGFM